MPSTKTILAIAALAVAAVAPQAARAATHEVNVGNNFFDPAVVNAVAGDTVHWTVSAGGHDVTTYGGTQSFASPLMFAGDDYSQTFGGGTVLYRCTPHSIILDNGKTCSGMCGAITDKVTPPATPDITSPAHGSDGHGNPVAVSGTGEAWTIVRLDEGATEVARALVFGDGTWTVNLTLSQGQHTLVATGLTVDGEASLGTDSVTFTMGLGADTTKPTVTIGTGNLSIFPGPVTISGTAFDNRGVSKIVVTFTPLIGAPTTRTATCVNCPNGTGGTVQWNFTFALFPGVYDVTAVATDTSNNVSDVSNSVRIISARLV